MNALPSLFYPTHSMNQGARHRVIKRDKTRCRIACPGNSCFFKAIVTALPKEGFSLMYRSRFQTWEHSD